MSENPDRVKRVMEIYKVSYEEAERMIRNWNSVGQAYKRKK